MTVVNVHQLHLLIPTLLTFTNFTNYHASNFLSTNSIESIVFGHWIVFVGRWWSQIGSLPVDDGGTSAAAAKSSAAAAVSYTHLTLPTILRV